MYLQANTEIVSRMHVVGYVTGGSPATHLQPASGPEIDVEAVYEIGADGEPLRFNLVKHLTANQREQAEAELWDAWIAATG